MMELNLVLCLAAVIFLVQPVMTKSGAFEEVNICPKERTITEEDVKTFNESYRNTFENVLKTTPSIREFIEAVKIVEVEPLEKRIEYFSKVCPSATKPALYWGIAYQSGYKCWIVQPVYFTTCLTTSCQNLNGVPWIPNSKFRCREKYAYEYVWSFCVRKRVTKFVLIGVLVPKCCVCTLSKC